MPAISDSFAPTLISATPSDNSSAVAIGANIVLTFSEAMSAGSGSITISDGATQTYLGRDGLFHTRLLGATDTRTFSITDSQVSISGNTVTINLGADLKPGLGYSVQMGSGVLRDAAGNAYAGLSDSTKLNFTTSNTAIPAAYVSGAISFTDTGISASDYITNETAQTIDGYYTGTLGSGEFVEVSTDNGASWHTASLDGNYWYYDTTLSASSVLTARVSNSVGGSSAALSHGYVLDQSGPAVPTMTISDTHLEAGETAQVTLVFSEKVTGVLGELSMQNAAVGEFLSADGGLTWTATLTPGEGIWGDGGLTYYANNAVDLAGNPGASGSVSVDFTVDTAVATVRSISLSNDTGLVNGDLITNIGEQDLGGSYSGKLVAGDKIQVSVDGAGWTDATIDKETHYWSLAGVTLSGSSDIRARVVDADGVEKSVHAENYQVDTSAPTVSMENVALDLSSASDKGYDDQDNRTSDDRPTVTVNLSGKSGFAEGDVIQILDNSEDGRLVGVYTITSSDMDSYGGYGALDFDSIDIALDYQDEALSAGAHQLLVRIGDLAGNTPGAASATALTVTIDNVAPTPGVVAPGESDQAELNTTITIAFNEEIEISAGMGHTVRIANDSSGEWWDITVENGLSFFNGQLIIVPPEALAPASHYTVTLYSGDLSDAAGNVAIAEGEILTSFGTTGAGTYLPDAPTLTLSEDTASTSGSGEHSDGITSSGWVTVAGLTASNWQYSIKGGDWTTVGDGTAFQLTAGSYAEGDIKVRQFNVDHAISAEGVLAGAIVVDTTAPTATIDAGLNFFGLTVPIDILGTYTGTLASDEHIEYSLDEGSSWARATEVISNTYVIPGVLLGDQGSAVAVRVTDVAGNLGRTGVGDAHTIFLGDGYGGDFVASSDTVYYAAGGNDMIRVSGGTVGKVDGGTGTDTLHFISEDNALDLDSLSGALNNIEIIDLGANSNRLLVTASAVAAVSGASALTINGDASDIVEFSGTWTYVSSSDYHHELSNGSATLLLDYDITLVGGPAIPPPTV